MPEMLSSANIETLDLKTLDNLIFPDMSGEKTPVCRAALVLGTASPNIDRTPKAVECYKAGLCQKLVFSGGVYWDTEYGRLTEAQYMERYALEHGVKQEDIILDNMARTTIENMLCGAIAIHRAFEYISEIKDLIIITSDYHMRRSMLIAEATLPRFIALHPVASKGPICKDNWTETERGVKRIRKEAGFIKAMILHGMTGDIEL